MADFSWKTFILLLVWDSSRIEAPHIVCFWLLSHWLSLLDCRISVQHYSRFRRKTCLRGNTSSVNLDAHLRPEMTQYVNAEDWCVHSLACAAWAKVTVTDVSGQSQFPNRFIGWLTWMLNHVKAWITFCFSDEAITMRAEDAEMHTKCLDPQQLTCHLQTASSSWMRGINIVSKRLRKMEAGLLGAPKMESFSGELPWNTQTNSRMAKQVPC